MSNFELKINPDSYLVQLQTQLSACVAEMRNTLRAIDDGSFEKRASGQRADAFLQIEINTTGIASGNAVDSACRSCFLGFIRSLITFIDRMISIKRVLGKKIEISEALTKEELFKKILDDLENDYRKVAKDNRLSNPSKLAELDLKDDFAVKATKSYFAARRCLEHHGNVTEEDLSLFIIKLKLLAESEEITELPYSVKKGMTINMVQEESELQFKAGEIIRFTEADIEQIFLTIQVAIGPQIRLAV